jgi:phosphatidylglycerol---prolipoprotein diacylglyceryl transferase
MYPYIYSSSGFVLGSYGLFLAIAYLAGRWYFLRDLEKAAPELKNTELLIILLLLLGVMGAKLLFILKNPDKSDLLFSGTGFSSQGALIGALIATISYSKFNQIKLDKILDSAAPAAILAYALARVGCFLSGDDCHGTPSDLPWAMAFPNGIEPTNITVHPVPLYEIIYSIGIFIFLIARQNLSRPAYQQFFILMGLWGSCRFLVEFVTTNEKLLLSMSGSQIGALLMTVSSLIYFSLMAKSNAD